MTHPFRIGLGTGSFRSGDECVESVARALDVGYRHVDTAEAYGNERFVRAGIEQSSVAREDVIVATKVHSDHLAYDDVIDQAQASARRLDVESIDLLYVHWPAHTYDPGETMAAFDELHDRGLVRHVGVCNFTADLLAEAARELSAPLVANQVEYHPFFQQPDLRDAVAERDMWLVAYSPLAGGRVTENPVLCEIAAAYDTTPATVTLSWLFDMDHVAVIPCSRGEHVEQNWAARRLQLAETDRRRIDDLDRGERLVDYDFAPWNRAGQE